MAVTATDPSPIAEPSATDATSYTTTATAGANSKLYIITVENSKGTTPDLPTLTHSGGLTCVQILSSPQTNRRITVFRALKTSGVSAGTFTADAAGVTQTSWSVIVDEFDGIDTSGTDGSGAIVQSAANNGSGTTASATLSAFADATNNAAFLATLVNNNTAVTEEAGGVWAELGEAPHGSPTRTIETEWRLGEDTSPSSTFLSSAWDCIALEIKVAAGGDATVVAVVAEATTAGVIPLPLVTIPVTLATATGAAQIPNPVLTVLPPASTATGQAEAPLPTILVPAALATATTAAQLPVPMVTILPGAMTALAGAEIPTIIKTGNIVINPPTATATGASETPTPAITVPGEVAAATGAAAIPTPAVTLPAVTATATSAADAPALSLLVPVVTATATGAGQIPTPAVTIPAVAATATGAAPIPTITISAGSGVTVVAVTATATAQAQLAAVYHFSYPGVVGWTFGGSDGATYGGTVTWTYRGID